MQRLARGNQLRFERLASIARGSGNGKFPQGHGDGQHFPARLESPDRQARGALGVRLFERTTRRVTLTTVGRVFAQLVRRNSLTSRSRVLIRSRSAVLTPSRSPRSTSSHLTQSRSVCGVQPIIGAIDSTAAHIDGCSLRCSRTKRTARARTSGKTCLASCSWLHSPKSWSLHKTRGGSDLFVLRAPDRIDGAAIVRRNSLWPHQPAHVLARQFARRRPSILRNA